MDAEQSLVCLISFFFLCISFHFTLIFFFIFRLFFCPVDSHWVACIFASSLTNNEFSSNCMIRPSSLDFHHLWCFSSRTFFHFALDYLFCYFLSFAVQFFFLILLSAIWKRLRPTPICMHKCEKFSFVFVYAFFLLFCAIRLITVWHRQMHLSL